MIRCESKNELKKDTCLKESEEHAQNVEIILSSMVNMIGEPIWPINKHENLHFDNE